MINKFWKIISSLALSSAVVPFSPSVFIDDQSFIPSCVQLSENIVFLGDSLTEGWKNTGAGAWKQFSTEFNYINLGVWGDSTGKVLKRLNSVTAVRPAKIFLMVGINNIARQTGSPTQIVQEYSNILDSLTNTLSCVTIYIQSLLPTAHHSQNHSREVSQRLNTGVLEVNKLLRRLATQNDQWSYVDLHSEFVDPNGMLKADHTPDGVHLSETGYRTWKQALTGQQLL